MNLEERSADRARREKIRKRKQRILYVILIFICAIILVSVVAAIVRQLQGTSSTQLIDDLGVSVEGEDGSIGELAVDSAAGAQFTAYQGGICFLTSDEFRIYSESGSQQYYRQVSMSDPVLKTGGSVNLIFDRGGTSYFVVNNCKETLNQSVSLPIINAGVNENGWSVIIAQESGYKSAVTVLNPHQEEVYYAYFSSSYVVAAEVSKDGNYLVTGALLQENGTFISRLSLYSLKESEPLRVLDIEDSVLLDLGYFSNGKLSVLTEDALLVYEQSSEGFTLKEETSFEENYLRAYSLGGDQFVSLVVSRFKVGGQGRLIMLDGSGNEVAPITIEEQVVSMSAAGDYIAVLTSSNVQIYNKNLELQKTETDISDVKKILMRSDGSALLVSTNSVRVLR